MDPAEEWRNGIDGLPNGRSKGYRQGGLSVFRVVNALAGCSDGTEDELLDWRLAMQLSWSEHLQTARTLELSGDEQRGTALALTGVALLVLAQDELEQPPAAHS